MTRKSKFYDIVPKENKSIRNIPIPVKSEDDDFEVEDIAKFTPPKKNSVKKHNHEEKTSVEIKKLDRPITNVEEYDKDEYIEIIDHRISDDDIVEETHLLNEDKEEIENTKIPSLKNEENIGVYTKRNMGKRKITFTGSYKLPTLIAGVVIFVILILSLFSSGTIIIKTADVRAPLTDGYRFDKGDGEMIQATSSMDISIESSGIVKVERFAKGTVVIFNNTSSTQKLVKNTKIQASNGLIYKLDQAVTVPAKKGKVLGSVTTNITAEVVGEKYNASPKDFTFPGFKGTAKYQTIYGRSKGNISGGYSGDVPNVSQSELNNKISTAKEEMKTVLNQKIKEVAIAGGFFIDNETIEYKIINSETKMSKDNKTATVKIDGSIFAKTLLNASVDEASKSILGIENSLSFKYEVNLASSSLEVKTDDSGQMIANGDVSLHLSVNKEELAKMLQNKTKREALSVLQQTKGVEIAKIKTFPFWKNTLPSHGGIKVLVQD